MWGRMVVTSLKINAGISLEGGNRPSRSLPRQEVMNTKQEYSTKKEITSEFNLIFLQQNTGQKKI